MGRKCSVCVSPDREAIETAIVNNVTYCAISDRYGMSEMSVSRHVTNGHIGIVVLEPVIEVESLSGTGVLERMAELAQQADAIGQIALSQKEPKLSVALAAIREQTRINEQLVKLAEILSMRAGQAEDEGLTLESYLELSRSRVMEVMYDPDS